MAETKVRDVMTTLVVTLDPDDTIHTAAQCLARNDISGAPVVKDHKVVGIVSESDILYGMSPNAPVRRGLSWFDVASLMFTAGYQRNGGHRKVADIMTRHATTIGPDSALWKAASTMQLHGIKRLPVVDDEGALIGIVSRGDLVAAMAKDDASICKDVAESLRVLGDDVFDDLGVEVEQGVATIRGRADRRSTHDIAIRITSQIPGVVLVRDHLDYEFDDSHIPMPRSISGRSDLRRNWAQVGATGDPTK